MPLEQSPCNSGVRLLIAKEDAIEWMLGCQIESRWIFDTKFIGIDRIREGRAEKDNWIRNRIEKTEK